MNKDSNYNTCLVEEEDTDKYDKMALTVGLQYIKSEFWEGCLVWAKMPGYCSWPAVVTRSLETDDFCHRNEKDEPIMYHVEYLGKTHSRGWIKRAALKMFSEGRFEEDPTQTQTTKNKKGKKKACVGKNLKTTFKKGETVEAALDEAIKMIPLSYTQRLDKCIFKYTYIEECSTEDPAKNKTIAPFTESKSNTKATEIKGTVESTEVKPQLKNTELNNTHSEPKTCVSYNTTENKTANDPSKQKAIDSQSKKNTELKSDEKDVNIEPPVSVVQFDFDNSLLNKTKEERYCLDVEMYTKNERAFEHDVLRFLMRNDIKYKGLPKMQNAPESMFQIYLAVHERGGYTEVCKKRQWMTVCREVVNTHIIGSSSNCIKNFYERYLYPYELYIKGEDFASYIKDYSNKKTVRKKGSIPPPPTVDQSSTDSNKQLLITASPIQGLPVSDTAGNFELLSECSADIQEMLDNLEKEESLCGLEEDVTAAKNKLGIDITFFDESPPVKDDVKTPSEFEEADLPIESAQEVPEYEVSDPMSDMESQEELFHEMQALQDGMEMIDNVLEQL
ncbi:AT-rich interactive domain-containing protein 4B [Patella vulgata]|uniref:AT-rich interactive domain-containing protein 4B n=1 Tax=Patella vulgata TaxID=6465 RepID=UPI0024A95469|nr:AT-rich interactive domain-containing protein 4B [Patella vulgata]